jgi:hypothetical protein
MITYDMFIYDALLYIFHSYLMVIFGSTKHFPYLVSRLGGQSLAAMRLQSLLHSGNLLITLLLCCRFFLGLMGWAV